MTTLDRRPFLRSLFDAAVAAAQPALCLPPIVLKYLNEHPPMGRIVVVGAGKASAAMARALEQCLPDPLRDRLSGLVITRYGYAVECTHIDIAEAAHPVPDEAGLLATQALCDRVMGLRPEDLVIALISGGGSSLLVAPARGLTLADKQAVNAALLKSGASITEMNCVRRHLSTVKGGRLAAWCEPARVLTLLISDVPGDNPIDIASGPTVADPTTCADALAILKRYQIDIAPAALALLERGKDGPGESIKPGDARLEHVTTRTITAPQIALEAAALVARAAGITPYILSDSLEGEARDIGKAMAGIVRQVALHGQPFQTPCVLLSGGETTVTLRGTGRGGRNVEFLLSLAIALGDLPGVHALAADTDGVDGIEEIAGAVMTPSTLARAWAQGINPRTSLDNNDGHGFFSALGDSVVTGPTLTNVNDFRAVVVG